MPVRCHKVRTHVITQFRQHRALPLWTSCSSRKPHSGASGLTPCSLIGGYQHFERSYCLYLHGRIYGQYVLPKRRQFSNRLGDCSCKYNQQDATLYNILYYCQCSTCFGRFLRPSSGAQELYTQHLVRARLTCC